MRHNDWTVDFFWTRFYSWKLLYLKKFYMISILFIKMSIRVLLKSNLRNSFSTLLVGLATSDSHFLFFAILVIGLPKLWKWYGHAVSVFIIPVGFGLLNVARTGSVYLTMSVTLERYFAIVRSVNWVNWIPWLIANLIHGAAPQRCGIAGVVSCFLIKIVSLLQAPEAFSRKNIPSSGILNVCFDL